MCVCFIEQQQQKQHRRRRARHGCLRAFRTCHEARAGDCILNKRVGYTFNDAEFVESYVIGEVGSYGGTIR